MALILFLLKAGYAQRGNDFPMFYATPTGATSDPGLFKTTLGTPNGGNKITSVGSSAWRCMEWFDDGSENGVIYVVTWTSGVTQLGIMDQQTGDVDYIANTVDATGLAVNPLTGIFYAVANEGSNSVFGTLNIETGAFSGISTLATNYRTYTIAIDNYGVCYAIGTGTSDLRVIDLATGAYSVAGSIEINPINNQNLSIDRETNELYWASRTSLSGRTFYRIDKSSGALTDLGECAQDYQAFCIVSSGSNLFAPAPVENLTVTPDASGALTASINWTNPSFTAWVGALTDLTAIEIYENAGATPIYSGSNPIIGADENYTTTVTASGLYTYTVVAENSEGKSQPSRATAWIGRDVPAAPENVQLTATGLVAQLAWSAPSEGLHGGYFTSEEILYDIFRMPSNELVSGNQAETTFTETITQTGTCFYRLVAKNAIGEGGEATSNTKSFCLMIAEFPWQEGFENNETTFPLCWEQEYVSGTTNWTVVSANTGMPNSASEGAYKARISGGEAEREHTTKLITPPFDLSATANPALKFRHTQRNRANDQDVCRVYYKNSSNGNWNLLEEYLTDLPDWTERVIELPEKSAEYYIAFEAALNSGYGVQLDEITIIDFQGYVDAELVAITAPRAGYNENLTENEEVKVVIRNNGNHPLSGFQLALKFNGTPVATENYTGSIPGLEEREYIFPTTLDLSDEGSYAITVTIVATADAVPDNDSKTISVLNIMGNLAGFPLEENFDNLEFPPSWTVYNVDQDQDDRTWSIHLFSHSETTGSAVHWYESPMQEGWLITPKLRLPNNMESLLEFWSLNRFPEDNYHSGIWISTTDASVGSFTLLKQLAGDNEISSSWKKISISLSDYAGDNVYLAFKYMGDDADVWFIDDISVKLSGIDGAARKVFGAVTPMVGEPFLYKVLVENTGTQPLTEYRVKLVDDDNNVLAVDAGIEIAPDETALVNIIWTPENAGSFALRAVLDIVGDINPTNDVTPAMHITVQPDESNLFEETIGTEINVTPTVPICFDFQSSRSQSIYFDHEIIGRPAKIIQIQYFNNFVSEVGSKPIKVWLANTTVSSLDEWLPESEFTLVFNGEIYFPIGKNTISIMFDIPFEYTGSNLVIMTDHPMDADFFSSNDVFYCTVTPEVIHRSRFYNSDTEAFNWTQPGTSIYCHPNIVIGIALEDLGTLSGSVSSETTPIEGVAVEIIGTTFKRITDEEGDFHFSIMLPGNHQIKASKLGYADVIAPVTIVSNDNTTVELTLTPLPTYTVSGKVTGTDAPEGILNVVIKLSGYDNYTTTTDENGNYSMANVYGGFTYNIQATVKGYEIYTSTVEVSANLTHNIELVEIKYPAFNPVAKEVGSVAVVSWEEPREPVTFRYDSGVCMDQLGFLDAAPKGVIGTCHRVSALLTKMSWYLTDNAGYHTEVNLFLFELDAAGQPTSNIIFSAHNVPTEVMQWCEYEFPQPVSAPNGFYIAMSHNTSFLSLGTTLATNEYPLFPETNFYSADYDAIAFAPIESAGFYGNLMLRAEGYLYEKTNKTVSKSVTGYAVYRLTDGDPEALWTELSGYTTELTYTDNTWSTLPDGRYRYAVKAVYSDGALSEARTTNILIKGGVGIEIEKPLSEVIVYSYRNVVYVKNENRTPLKSVIITDIRGRVIHKSAISDVETTISLQVANGIYYVNLISQNNTIYTTKIPIQN